MIIKILSLFLMFLSWLNLGQGNLSQKISSQIEKERTYKVAEKNSGAEDYNSAAAGVLLYDLNNNSVLYSKQAGEKRSLASVTKLMTALVFSKHRPAVGTYYKIKAEDLVAGGRSYVFLGEELKVEDLLSAMLVGSENSAARALAASTGLSEKDFVAEMNKEAKNLGMINSSFADPAGLLDNNISTAKETAILAQKAFAVAEIKRAASLESVEIETKAGKKRMIASTNRLLKSLDVPDLKIMAGKTGHTDAAGYCLVTEFSDKDNNRLLSVVLGAGSEGQRFSETDDMLKWFYKNYNWK